MLITFLHQGWILCGTQSSSMDTIAELRNLHKIWVKHDMVACNFASSIMNSKRAGLKALQVWNPSEFTLLLSSLCFCEFLLLTLCQSMKAAYPLLTSPTAHSLPEDVVNFCSLSWPQNMAAAQNDGPPDSEAAEYADYAAKIKRSALWGSSHLVSG
jgi:hypothetical protein